MPTPTWGRPAFGNGGIPSAGPAGNWGRPSPDEIDIPTRSQELAQRDSSNLSPTHDLLPHERRAREMMIQKEINAQKRPVSIRMPGSETNRAGRPQPLNETERLDWARRALEKKQAREAHDRQQAMLNGPRIRRDFGRRHIMGDVEPTRNRPELEGAVETSQWSQLRRRGEGTAREQPKPRDNTFEEGRARREEQAKSGRYTPLGSRSIFSALDRHPPKQNASMRPLVSQQGESQSRNNQILLFGRGAGGAGPRLNEEPKLRESFKLSDIRGSVRSQPDRGNSMPTASTPERATVPDTRSPLSSEGSKERGYSHRERDEVQRNVFSRYSREDIVKEPKERERSSHSRFNVEDEVEERPKKSRTRRGADPVVQASYDDVPRGKGRDKAKRRQQFATGEEEDDAQESAAQRAEQKRLRKLEKAAKKAAAPTPMLLPEYITVSNLAAALKVRLETFVSKMQELGFEETSHDHILNAENAGLIAMEYNFEPIIDRSESEDLKAREPAKDPLKLPQRPPVITIMGHVDHGKTTLLDWLRKSSVAATEHGGITQHIGAFSVRMPTGKLITFLDTPGHAAFLSMRQRGANVTDIVILVVAADDSVKPQTIEAINHAKAAKVPVIVAINKIDKEDSNIDRVKQDLARHGIDVEDFGGDTQVVCVSGKTGQGMEELEEAAITLSEILDMRAERSGQAEGWVLEASIKSMGKVATVLVRRGTMRPGDFIVAGKTWARIRCLRNEAGVEITKAGPGTPVEIDGWREQPEAGDEVLQAPDETKAKSVVEYRLEKGERDRMAQDMEAINESRKAEQEKRGREKYEAVIAAEAKAANEEVAPSATAAKPSGPKEVYFIVKGDVSGSVEAVIDSISALGNKEVQPHILRSGVGQLSEFDIEHAAAAKGHVINFNTVVEPNISRLAEDGKVSIIDHNIIYRLVDDVKAELSKHLPPLITQRVLGEAEVAQIFEITVKGRQQKAVAGCKVRNGTIAKNAKVRVLRGGEKVFNGTSLLIIP
jgi:translation initiation factor IF-2